jgi:hypothetical protein
LEGGELGEDVFKTAVNAADYYSMPLLALKRLKSSTGELTLLKPLLSVVNGVFEKLSGTSA